MRFARTAATVLAALLLPVTAHTAVAAGSARVRAPGEMVTLPMRDALDQLPVRVEHRTGYERSKSSGTGWKPTRTAATPRWRS